MQPSHTETQHGSSATAQPELSWSALLAAYRLGPKDRWSGSLLERLGPWLTKARHRLTAVPPYLDREDIAQQLVVEVLQIAARWRPGCEDRWIPRRLVEAAERRVRHSLTRERSSLAVELADEVPASTAAEPDLLFETPIGAASVEDLRVLYRVKVLGEPVAALAREAGLTPRQVRRRVSSARTRARATHPSRVRRG